MANVFVEPRPKGRPEGSAIEDYIVEDHADHVLGTLKRQEDAIAWSKQNGHSPLVARVRHLNDKKNPDHWRSARSSSRYVKMRQLGQPNRRLLRTEIGELITEAE